MLLVLSLTISANPITRKQALQKAQVFVGSRMKSANSPLRFAYQTSEKSDSANLFVFNIGAKKGFVVISGEDQDGEVLAYVDEGEFDLSAMPESMIGWLRAYEEYLQMRRAQRQPVNKLQYHPTTVVEPLITSKWGQREPYNSLCPSLYGIQTPTGCTATALAQVMRFHQYPVEACQEIPAYETSTNHIKMPALEPTTFDWDKMPDELFLNSSQESIDAVSKLMLYCGQSHNMNYTTSGSGAYTYIIPERLPVYFGYANTMHYVYRKSYSEQEWDSLLVKELVNRRPVIYTAYTNLSQGHTFICDGYDGNGLFHINWGWNGVANGFYRISEAFATEEELNDNIKNYHLSIDQTALLGLQPSGEDDFVAPLKAIRAYSRPSLKNGRSYSRASVSADFTGITIKQKLVNTSKPNTTNATRYWAYGQALCDENDNVLKVLGSATARISVGDTKTYELVDASLGAGLADGHYTIKPVFRANTSSTWRTAGGAEQNYIDVVVDGLDMTLTPVPRADFVVKDINMEKSYVVLKLENPYEAFYGPLYIRRYNSSTGKIAQVSYDYISFDPTSSEQFDIYVEDSKKFDIYNDVFYLSVDDYDTQYFYCSLSNATIEMDKHFEILNPGETELSAVGDRIMLRLTLESKSNFDYENYVTTELVNSQGEVVQTISEVVELKSGATREFLYELPVSDFEQEYVVRTTHKESPKTWGVDSISGVTVSRGAIYWTKDGTIKTKPAAANFKVPEDALAINVREAYTSRVTPNSNPNTIYMLGSKMARGLENKNYVNSSNRGTQLHLTDSCDYYFPCKMLFSGTVSYTRAIHEDDSLRWDAITLPFAPTAITADGDTIDWCKSADDKEGVFWMMEFDGIENDTLRTQYAQEMRADVPYLMATSQQLAGKSLVFSAQKVAFAPTSECIRDVALGDTILHGTYCRDSQPGGYVFSEGALVYAEQGEEVVPFRAYLTFVKEEMPDTLVVSPVLGETEQIPEPTPKMGDVNDDGTINITDVMLLVNYIIGKIPSVFVEENADMDGSGDYNIADVMLLVNMLLEDTPESPGD